MSSQLSEETIEKVVDFHGHSCPGLSIGIRASELARRELGDLPDTRMVCMTETDMCGVDAVQYLIGCTFGKGNLIYRDYGKMGFTFFNRRTGEGVRLAMKPDTFPINERQLALFEKTRDGSITAAEQEELKPLACKGLLTC